MEDFGARLRNSGILLLSVHVPRTEGEPWRVAARRDAGFAYGMPKAELSEAIDDAITAFVRSNQYSLPAKKAAPPKVQVIEGDLLDLLG